MYACLCRNQVPYKPADESANDEPEMSLMWNLARPAHVNDVIGRPLFVATSKIWAQ